MKIGMNSNIVAIGQGNLNFEQILHTADDLEYQIPVSERKNTESVSAKLRGLRSNRRFPSDEF